MLFRSRDLEVVGRVDRQAGQRRAHDLVNEAVADVLGCAGNGGGVREPAGLEGGVIDVLELTARERVAKRIDGGVR